MATMLLAFGAFAGATATRAQPVLSMTLGGLERSWKLAIPNKLATPVRVVVYLATIDLAKAAKQDASSTSTKWRALGEEEGFMVVWPQAARPQGGGSPVWNAGGLGNGANTPGGGPGAWDVDDVGFLRRLAANVSTTHGADISRHVYWAGDSTGCAMAQRMAAGASSVVAAVGCASQQPVLESQRAVGTTRLMWDFLKRHTPRVAPPSSTPLLHAVARREDPADVSTAPSSAPTPAEDDDDDDGKNVKRHWVAVGLVVIVLITCMCVCKIMYPVMAEVAAGALDKPAGPTSLSVLAAEAALEAAESPNWSEHGFVN